MVHPSPQHTINFLTNIKHVNLQDWGSWRRHTYMNTRTWLYDENGRATRFRQNDEPKRFWSLEKKKKRGGGRLHKNTRFSIEKKNLTPWVLESGTTEKLSRTYKGCWNDVVEQFCWKPKVSSNLWSGETANCFMVKNSSTNILRVEGQRRAFAG